MANFPWSLVSPHGILIDEAQEAWWSGHVTDILELDGGAGGLLVATETGGAWLLTTNNDSLPLSDNWDQPNINCLAAGPDGPRHFFAACDAAVIYETDVSQNAPLLSWTPVADPLPSAAGEVRSIAVVAGHRIVVAATDDGVYWSRIPRRAPAPGCLGQFIPLSLPGGPTKYDWKRAIEPTPAPRSFFDVAIGSFSGPGKNLTFQNLGDVSVVLGTQAGGVFVGQWQDANSLVLQQGRVLESDGTDMTDWYFLTNGFSSVVVCEGFPNICYAACAAPDGLFKMVLRSNDGGRRWLRTGFDLKNFPGQEDIRGAAGEKGEWNNCIGVMRTSAAWVALGWQTGTFLSPDGGATWIALSGSPHLHPDVHVVRFRDAAPNDQFSLLIGSDGGIAEVSVNDAFEMKTTARSDFNRNLPTLQCYATWPIPRQFVGGLAVSASGFAASGVQDNGNVYLDANGGGAWCHLDDGDGGSNAFLSEDALVRRISGQTPVRALTIGARMGPTISGEDIIPITFPAPADPGGLKTDYVEAVRVPHFRNRSKELMLAVAGRDQDVFGLFSDRKLGGTFHWDRIGTVPAGVRVTALGSHGGDSVHVGTTTGRFFALDTKNGTMIELGIQLPMSTASTPQSDGQPTRIVTLSKTDAFAVLNQTTDNYHYVLRLDGLQWRPPPLLAGLPITAPIYGLDGAFRGRDRLLFASTDDHVYFSSDGGDNWVQESQGLPRRCHGADIRIAITKRGGFVYLSTFGRSVYRAFLGEVEWHP